MTEAREKLASMTEKIESLNETQNYDRSKLLSSYTYNKQMYAKRINKLNEKIIMKRTKTNSSYSFQYGDIS